MSFYRAQDVADLGPEGRSLSRWVADAAGGGAVTRELVGWLMIATPFVGIAAYLWWTVGPLGMLGSFAVAALIAGLIVGGVHLVNP